MASATDICHASADCRGGAFALTRASTTGNIPDQRPDPRQEAHPEGFDKGDALALQGEHGHDLGGVAHLLRDLQLVQPRKALGQVGLRRQTPQVSLADKPNRQVIPTCKAPALLAGCLCCSDEAF